eukprot:Rhum_TRINITY_DN7924_c0_g1::Rhum_TRINITY_DN7924_c0_g1_i1::g.25204::m.25204
MAYQPSVSGGSRTGGGQPPPSIWRSQVSQQQQPKQQQAQQAPPMSYEHGSLWASPLPQPAQKVESSQGVSWQRNVPPHPQPQPQHARKALPEGIWNGPVSGVRVERRASTRGGGSPSGFAVTDDHSSSAHTLPSTQASTAPPSSSLRAASARRAFGRRLSQASSQPAPPQPPPASARYHYPQPQPLGESAAEFDDGRRGSAPHSHRGLSPETLDFSVVGDGDDAGSSSPPRNVSASPPSKAAAPLPPQPPQPPQRRESASPPSPPAVSQPSPAPSSTRQPHKGFSPSRTMDASATVTDGPSPRVIGIAAAILVAVGLLVFGIVCVAAHARSIPEQPFCLPTRRYALVHETSYALRDGVRVSLDCVTGVATAGNDTVVIGYDASDTDRDSPYDSPPVLTARVAGAQLHALSHQGRGVLYNAGAPAVGADGGVWVPDRTLHMVVKLGVLHGSGVAVAAGRFGQPGDAEGMFDRPTAVAVADGHVLVLDEANCRIVVLREDGVFVRAFGSRGRLLGAVDIAGAGGIAYVATARGILVYDYVRGAFMAEYETHVSGHPMDHLKYSLDGEWWRHQVTSITYDPHGKRIVTVEGGQVVFRSTAGEVLCYYGSFDKPVGAAVLRDGRVVVAERGGGVKVYALESA